jgi:hypothetical protein
MPTRTHYETILQSANEPYLVLPLQGEAAALITQRGGRVLGIFPTPESDNLLWTNSEAFASPERFAAFLEQGSWNLGGERVWIAPEIMYNVQDRSDFWGSINVPSLMDPGAYTLEQHASLVRLHTQMRLTAYNIGEGQQEVAVDRRVVAVRDPLLSLSRSLPDLHYCGYQHQVKLRTATADLAVESWNLVQVKAGGQLIIPCLPEVTVSDYFGSVPDEVRTVLQSDTSYLRLYLDGKRQYKIGYQSVSVTGRMGYWQPMDNGHAVLLVRSFFNNPSNRYAEEPQDVPGKNGHSIHVYNDGGEFGGEQSFGEMECSGTTIDAAAALPDNTATDTFVMWIYTGPDAAVRCAAHLLLGVHL